MTPEVYLTMPAASRDIEIYELEQWHARWRRWDRDGRPIHGDDWRFITDQPNGVVGHGGTAVLGSYEDGCECTSCCAGRAVAERWRQQRADCTHDDVIEIRDGAGWLVRRHCQRCGFGFVLGVREGG